MSDIKVGDLVVVVRPPLCPLGKDGDLGRVFTVKELERDNRILGRCPYCWGSHDAGLMMARSGHEWFFVRRLRRIPPLSELESTEHKEETPA